MQSMNDRVLASTLQAADAAVRQRKGAQALIDVLVECDVDVIFGYPGGAVRCRRRPSGGHAGRETHVPPHE
jgi:hypothetical protein